MTMFSRDRPEMRLHANGNIEMYDGRTWVGGIAIKSDGTIIQEGKELGRVSGDVIARFDYQKRFVLDATTEHVTTEDPSEPPLFARWGYSIAPSGALTGIGNGTYPGPVRVEGARTPGQLRTMVVVCVAFWAVAFPDIGKFMEQMD